MPSVTDVVEPSRAALETLESWNYTRFNPHTLDPTRGHLESLFFKFNDPLHRRALWVKLTFFAPITQPKHNPTLSHSYPVAEAWAIVFDASLRSAPSTQIQSQHMALKETVPIEQAVLAYRSPFVVRVANVEFDGRRLSGEIRDVQNRVQFDLLLSPKDKMPLVHFPWSILYEQRFPKTKLVSPMVDATATGTIEVQDASGSHVWQVDQWPAMQGHNWGTRHAHSYAWGHVNHWNEPEGNDVVFEGFSAQIKVGPFVTPYMTILALRYRGVHYEMKTIRDLYQARGSLHNFRRWDFSSTHADAHIEGSISMREEDIVGLYYPNPNGDMTYCLNSKLAHATLHLTLHRRPTLHLTSDAAALEIATHNPNHGVKMYV